MAIWAVMRALGFTIAMQFSAALAESTALRSALSPGDMAERAYLPFRNEAKRIAQAAHRHAEEDRAQQVLRGTRNHASASAAFHKGEHKKDAGRSGANSSTAQLPCQCEAENSAWVKSSRTVPRCVFVDLGAADGNTFASFLRNGYGPVAECPSGQWSAVLVEANPLFTGELSRIAAEYLGSVDARSGTAAYDCEGQTSFYVDTVNTEHNYWGSSMSPRHPDAAKSGHQQVTVQTLNINRYLYENTIPGDWVMLKMDIEGAEWEVIPCLAQSGAASLVDRLYLEEHPQDWQQGYTTEDQMQAAKAKLMALGVDIPASYHSLTL
mmetsp:Transcript_5994/g.10276  ORF Transcript_5994/g.10276 Transcript_5994/m.10276 type:complete len:323 (+) Transcript_5994:86-1054(+)